MKRTLINPHFLACDQDWHSMPEQEGGRLCNACERVLTDFTSLTDQEILNKQRENNFKLCGTYTRSQVDRMHRYLAVEESQNRTPWLVSLLMGSSVLAPIAATAQVPFNTDSITVKSPAMPGVPANLRYPLLNIKDAPSDSIHIHATVIDKTTGETLPFAIVQWGEPDTFVTTDLSGNFQLQLPKADSLPTLSISMEGYEHAQVPLSNTDRQTLSIALKPMGFVVEVCRPVARIMGEMVISVTIVDFVPFKWAPKVYLNPANWYFIAKKGVRVLYRKVKDKELGSKLR